MERHVADVCACLEGSVYLVPSQAPSSEPSDGLSLPVPWIAITFRTETTGSATRNASPNQSSGSAQRASTVVPTSTKNNSRRAVQETCMSGVSGVPLGPKLSTS
ncbi:hypothetical protein PHYSODRAFT_355797 [Phytophthora sojae]|uniref:Uncharacterized protein n=1 Tax=Phytophthora sojae (strain P6497) TaxID=1094619 RepID=G5A4I6_PHYSP|nr:hypothetical protein PHYSODRAFT_355797 [Phytophthora sojae]EGZ09587.1 hypothetical protein PHYSODRAFT_355797 [Phytophthora sojae]|eukprot:XP_009534448.1 hypothetical protein PHYSODRAFT_355797 [Phytophthora sojae]